MSSLKCNWAVTKALDFLATPCCGREWSQQPLKGSVHGVAWMSFYVPMNQNFAHSSSRNSRSSIPTSWGIPKFAKRMVFTNLDPRKPEWGHPLWVGPIQMMLVILCAWSMLRAEPRANWYQKRWTMKISWRLWKILGDVSEVILTKKVFFWSSTSSRTGSGFGTAQAEGTTTASTWSTFAEARALGLCPAASNNNNNLSQFEGNCSSDP